MSRKKNLFIFKTTYITCIHTHPQASTFRKKPTISAMTLQSIYGKIFTKVITPLVWNIHRMLSVSIISWCFRCTLFALQLMHYWRIKQCIFHLRELIYLLLFIINITHIHWGGKKYFSFLRFRGACWLTVLFCLYTMSWNPAFFPPSSKRRSVFFTSVYFFLLALKMKSQQKNLTCTRLTSTFLQSDLIQSCWSTGIYLRDSLSHQGC